MGNSASSTARAAWKGPFSDEEYECLNGKFNELIASASSEAAVVTNLQTWLELSPPAAAPEELTAPCFRLGSAFYRLCLEANENDEMDGDRPKSLLMEDFARAVAHCVRASSQSICRSLFRLFAENARAGAMTEQGLSQLLFACLVMAGGKDVDDADRIAHVAKSLGRAAMPPTHTEATNDDFVRWIGAQFPLLYTVFMSWMSRKSFGTILTKAPYELPRLSHQSGILARSHFVALSTVTTSMQTSLSRLYTSAQDGLSFNRLSYHILGYSGPTLTVIRDTQGAVFGMFCDTEWKESSRYYGGNGCFLCRMEPDISIYRVSASGSNKNYMYLNSKGVALPRGLGIGGSTEKFRLFLGEDLDEHSYTTPKDLSFESGRLSSSEQFSVEAIEVWGCGGEESKEGQKTHRQETADLISRARKVDKAQFVGSDFDKEMFLGKTFGHGTDRARVADDEP